MLESNSRKSIYKQLIDLLTLTYRTKYWPHNYFKYKGYLKEKSISEIEKYLPGRLFDCLRDDLLNDSDYVKLVDNKYLFNRILWNNNIPATAVLGRHIKGVGFFDLDNKKVNSKIFKQKVIDDFVIKPVIGSAQGSGVDVIDFNHSDRHPYSYRGMKLSWDTFVDQLNDPEMADELLFEGKVIQHKTISDIYAKSINTIRIDSLRLKNGDILILSASLRVGRNGRLIDNWSGEQGGIAVGVNIVNGRVNEVGFDYYLKKYQRHPDTNYKFNDFQIPYWDRLIEIVKKSASLFPQINSLGWDIAITENGPLIIEVNSDYTIQLCQSCNYPYLTNKPFIKGLLEYINASNSEHVYAKYFTGKYI